MTNNKLHLCPGTLQYLICNLFQRDQRKDFTSNRNYYLWRLVSIMDETPRGLHNLASTQNNPNDFRYELKQYGTYQTSLINCEEFHEGNFCNFGNQSVCKQFQNELWSSPETAFGRVSDYLSDMINDQDLVKFSKCLLYLLECDDELNKPLNDYHLYALPGFKSTTVENLLKQDKINIHQLFLAVLYYVYEYGTDNTLGLETIETWGDELEEAEQITVTYKKAPGGLKLFYKEADERYGDDLFYVDLNECIQCVKYTATCNDSQSLLGYFNQYHKTLFEINAKMQSNIGESFQSVREFYCSPNLCDINNNLIVSVEDIKTNLSILAGNGGMGKSTTLRKFLLDLAEDNMETVQKVAIPFSLSEIRSLDFKLETALIDSVHTYDSTIPSKVIQDLLKTEHAYLLLDGFEEIESQFMGSFVTELKNFINTHPGCHCMITSRFVDDLRFLDNFTLYTFQPLSKKQSREIIRKITFKGSNLSAKSEFIKALEENKMGFSEELGNELLGNPLFLTMMYQIYAIKKVVPKNLHVLYDELYNVMATRHLSAGEISDFYTGFTPAIFKEYFAEFCMNTYFNQDYTFNEEILYDYFNEIVQKYNLNINPSLFIKDVVEKLCFLYKKGDQYYFIHRSFQEFFAAYYFMVVLKNKNSQAIDDKMYQLLLEFDFKIKGNEFYSFMKGLDYERLQRTVYLPYLRDFFENASKEEDLQYQEFLCRFFPTLYYLSGIMDCYLETYLIPASAIYRSLYGNFKEFTYEHYGMSVNLYYWEDQFPYSERITGEVYYDPEGEYTMDEDGYYIPPAIWGTYHTLDCTNVTISDWFGIDKEFITSEADFPPYTIYKTLKDYYLHLKASSAHTTVKSRRSFDF